jgi:hypothetical protein
MITSGHPSLIGSRPIEKVREALSGRFKVGVYGSGTVAKRMKSRGLIDLTWLAGATGWSGTEDALRRGDYALFQKFLEKRSEIGRFDFDGNVLNPSVRNFGQFGPDGVLDAPPDQGAAAIFKVIARPDLNLRGGPGESFPVVRKVPLGTLVTSRGRDGPWLAIDLEGDGNIDGFMFARSSSWCLVKYGRLMGPRIHQCAAASADEGQTYLFLNRGSVSGHEYFSPATGQKCFT